MSSLSGNAAVACRKDESISEEMVGNHALDLIAVSLAKLWRLTAPEFPSAKALGRVEMWRGGFR